MAAPLLRLNRSPLLAASRPSCQSSQTSHQRQGPVRAAPSSQSLLVAPSGQSLLVAPLEGDPCLSLNAR